MSVSTRVTQELRCNFPPAAYSKKPVYVYQPAGRAGLTKTSPREAMSVTVEQHLGLQTPTEDKRRKQACGSCSFTCVLSYA